jgi:maleylacetoacetate isomerase
MTKQAPRLVLHGFFNSSAAYRVRIALALKGLPWRHAGVNLRAGEHKGDAYRTTNPAGLVPALQIGDNKVLGQSLVIIDHLDRLQAEPRLIPVAGADRDRVLEISQTIACDIHPLNNLRVLKYLVGPLALSDEQKNTWYAHWIQEGLRMIESLLPDRLLEHDGWCVGDAPTMADCCLVPQLANARRMKVAIDAYPKALRADAFAREHPAFVAAEPEKQPDYVAG